MGGQVTLPHKQAEDHSAQLQTRIRRFTAFYEQHAYLTYNLALRIACEPETAKRAVQEAFLSQLDDRPAGLLPSTVTAALAEAPASPSPGGAGDPDSAALLAAVAELAPPERAALAMADLAHLGPDGIGDSLGLDGEQAAKLLHRGREAFGARLGLPRTQADEVARDWMWAVPPDEVWEELYPTFHREMERKLRRGDGEQTLILSPTPDSAPAAKRPSRRRRRWSRRPRWGIVIPLVALLAAGGVAVAQLTSRHSGGSPDAASSAPIAPAAPQTSGSAAPPTGVAGGAGANPHEALTPAQLDKLKLRELRMLRSYTKRQADKRLSSRERIAAAREIAALKHQAQQRLLAQSRRDRIARDRLARQRARANAPPPPPPTTTRPTTTPKPAPAKKKAPQHQSTNGGGAPQNKTDADKSCLLDQDTGQYICPQ